MIDATSPRHFPAEPHSDSRLSWFAQGVRSVMKETIEVNQVTVRLVGAIAIVVALAGSLVAVTVWLTNLSHRANAGATLQQSVKDLGDKMERLSGQMETVISTRNDVTKLQSDLDSLRDRHTELFSMFETNRAYTNQLAGLMRERGIAVPEPPPTLNRRE